MNDKTYDLNEVATMSGLSTRTLRNYLNQGFLKGDKTDGTWRFTVEDIERFFAEPFVKESLRIKRTAAVFDFLADRKKETEQTCVILDIPSSLKKGNEIAEFFCRQIENVSGIDFRYDRDGGCGRIILYGAAESVATLMKAYYSTEFKD